MSRIFLSVGIIAALLTSASTNAQKLNFLSYADAKSSYASTKHESAYLSKNVTHAMKHFTSTYGEDKKESWSAKSDGYRASFRKNGIVYLVDYNKKGKLTSVIRIYNEKVLPKDIRRIIKSTFYDFDIVSVSEVSLLNELVYIVKIQDEVSLKTVRVMNHEMDVVEEFRRADR